MFEAMRRKERQITGEETEEILKNGEYGIFSSVGEDGYPYGVPVNYIFYNGRIYFHCAAQAGKKLDNLEFSDKVCFTVYGNEAFEEGDWAPYLHSVIVFGRCKLVADAGQTEDRVRELALKYYPTKEEAEAEIAKSIHAVQLYEITIEHMTGKRVHEK